MRVAVYAYPVLDLSYLVTYHGVIAETLIL